MQLNFTHIKHLVFTLIVLSLFGVSKAQVKFSTAVSPEQASLDDIIEVEYVIENAGSVENFTPPQFKHFKLLHGPLQSANMTVINGVMSRSRSVSYILQPETTGRLTIPGAIAIINGKTMRSNAVTIKVTGSGGRRNRQQPPVSTPLIPDIQEQMPQVNEEYRLQPGEDVNEKIVKNLLVKLDVNKTSCYEGEPVMATYKLCSRLKSESRIIKRPSLNGFSVFDMEDPGAERMSIEKINGKYFNVHLIRRSQLLPLQPGSYTLEPVELENKVEFIKASEAEGGRSNSRRQRLLEEFFGHREREEVEVHTITLKSNPATITVHPLPAENKPAGFKGAVGKFTIQATLLNKTITAGDAAKLRVVIKGSGNLPVVNAPQISIPAGVESFDPSVKEEVNKTVYPLSGSKIFDYTLIPRDSGHVTIPPVKFSYFDPSTASYNTISSDTLKMYVREGKTKSPAQQKAYAQSPAQTSKWTDVITSGMLVWGMAILLAMAALIYLLQRQRSSKKVKADTKIAMTTTPETTDRLLDARLALAQSKTQEFYSEINRALREAICEKTGSSLTELTKSNLPFKLAEAGTNVETIQDVEAIMKECEIALYTPVYGERDMRITLERAERAIKNI